MINERNTEIQIKTGDFEYINRKIVADTDKEAVEAFLDLKNEFKEITKAGPGLSKEDFDVWLDTYLETNKGNVELYSQMSLDQQNIIQIIKRSVKRITYKNSK